jgi:hypothetical protein
MEIREAVGKIKVGDTVITNGYRNTFLLNFDIKGRVIKTNKDGFYLEVTEIGKYGNWFKENFKPWSISWDNKGAYIHILSSEETKKWSQLIKEKIMNIKEKFLLFLTQEPYKSLRKAKIVDDQNMLTDDGATIFLGWLLMKYADEFKKEVVDKLLKEQKEE